MSDDRLMDLEVKVAFQERLLAELDEVIQQLRGELEALQGDVRALTEALEAHRGQVVDEKPPHY